RRAAAAQLRLEVAGEAAGDLDHQWPEIVLEEVPGSGRVAVFDAGGGVADPLPLAGRDGLLAAIGGDSGLRPGDQLGAGPFEGHDRLALSVVVPTGDLVERDRRHSDFVVPRAAAAAGASGKQTGSGEHGYATGQNAPAH